MGKNVFFLSKEQEDEYKKKQALKPKTRRSYIRSSLTSNPKKDKRLSSSSFKPEHWDSALKAKAGKVIHLLNHFTEEGLLTGIVYHFEEDDGYEVRIMDVDYKIKEQKVFEDLKIAKAYLASHVEKLGELEKNGLVKCLEDMIKMITNTSEEVYFMFRLLTDPNERKQYELTELPDDEIEEPKSSRKIKRKDNSKKLKKHGNELTSVLKSKLKNL